MSDIKEVEGKLVGGAPLVVEDLDPTMGVTIFVDPTYVNHWKLRAFLSFFGIGRHPSVIRAEKHALWMKEWEDAMEAAREKQGKE